MKIRFAAWLLLCATTTVQAQWFDWMSPGVPRTADGRPDLVAPVPVMPDGKPDLSGIWVPDDARGSL
ncbi:MAG: hypothetical protein ACO3PV_04285, partial [Pseudohongiellaceae bacterium]